MAGGGAKRHHGGRFTSVPRGELAALIYGALDGRVETIFDDRIAAIEEAGDEVRVRFERAPSRVFDLVIGADGLHSQVRRLAFDEESRFEKYLGLKVAAFAAAGYRPWDELVYVLHNELGQQVCRFTMRDDRTMFILVFADPDPGIPGELTAQKALLREKFSGSGWECAKILDTLDHTDVLYLDRVSQIRMDRWTRGRVALAGDAAFCVSLLGGQRSALAMTAAYILAGELKRANGSHEAVFARYPRRLSPDCQPICRQRLVSAHDQLDHTCSLALRVPCSHHDSPKPPVARSSAPAERFPHQSMPMQSAAAQLN